MVCENCGRASHFLCKLKHLQKVYIDRPFVTCENCHTVYDKPGDIAIYGTKNLVCLEKDKLRELCWLDYLFD